MAGVGVGKRLGVSIVYGVEKRRVAVVRRVSEKVPIEPRHEIGSVALVAEGGDAAQSRLGGSPSEGRQRFLCR